MAVRQPQNGSTRFSLLRRLRSLLGVGGYLLASGLLLEGLTVIAQRWISLPIPCTLEIQVLLTVPCVGACLVGMVWFNRSLDLVGTHLLGGKNRLITHGPFAYVRHPLYSTIMMTIPPLAIIWFSDLVFFIPWVLILICSHWVVHLEERELIEIFGQDYEEYRRCVPALIPYRRRQEPTIS